MSTLIVSFARNVFRHWLVLLSSAVFTFLGLFVLHTNKSNHWTEWANYVLALICLLSSTFLAWRDKDAELKLAVRQLDELKSEMEDRTAFLGAVIHEALLIPSTHGADVFLDTEISNERVSAPTLVTHYEVQLLIGNKKFMSSRLLQDADQYESFNWDLELADPNDSHLTETTWDEKRLTDLSKEISDTHPVVHNLPRRGWLHFRLDQLPPWPFIKRGTGYTEWQAAIYDEDGEEVSPAEEIEVTVAIPDTRSVGAVVLEISVPGGSGSIFMAGIDHSGQRRIRRIEA